MLTRIRSLLVANRGEIAIRVMRAANELGIRTIAIYSQEDRFSLHRTKADEAYLVGRGKAPVDAYLDIEDILRIAVEAKADAIHPGYGFLSENPDFVDACNREGVIFVGPTPEIMRTLGNKVAARNLATSAGVPVMPATPPLPEPTSKTSKKQAAKVGYPVMLKASWGGGGRGMRVIESDAQLTELLPVARREAKAGFGNDEVYLEKLVRKARHIEVQILGDTHGNLVHLFERDCTVQRRNQKVVERAPAAFLTDAQRNELCGYALQIGRAVNYRNAGTVEFLQDAETGKFYFIEVNPRIQVEHTVTEAVTNIDLVKAQIRIADGAKIGEEASGVPAQEDIHLTSHALQCRVTTEDPENGFSPDYGKITAYRRPAGFGIRLDAGTAYAGAILTRSYDSMLVKVTAWAPNPVEAIARMHRALWEFRIRGVSTNLRFLDQVITHPKFANADYTTKFIDETPELFKWEKKRDRATRILSFIGETIVNGNPEVKGRLKPKNMVLARLPKVNVAKAPPPGTKQKLDELGAEGFAKWMLAQKQVLITDTTMRDAHQSLAGDAHASARHGGHRALLRAHAAAAVLGGMLGRRHVRRRHALPPRGPVVATRAVARAHAQPAVADAAALVERRGLHQLPRQRGARVRQAGGDLRRRRVPRVRLAQLGGEHARRHRRRARDRQAVRSGHLLFGQSLVAERDEVHARLLPRDGPQAEGRRHAHPRHQGHGGPLPAQRGVHAGEGAQGRAQATRAFPHARHVRHRRGECARGGGRRLRRRRRRHRRDVGLHVAAESRLHHRSAALQRPRIPASTTAPCAPSRCTGSRCARTTSRSRATCARARPRCTCTRCPAGNTRISRSRRAPSASTIRAGPRCRRRMPT